MYHKRKSDFAWTIFNHFFTPKTGLNLFFVYLPTLFLISIARQHNKTTM